MVMAGGIVALVNHNERDRLLCVDQQAKAADGVRDRFLNNKYGDPVADAGWWMWVGVGALAAGCGMVTLGATTGASRQ